MDIRLLFWVPLMALHLVIIIALIVRMFEYPQPKNWIEVDMGVIRKPLLQHMKDCGLIYPVLFVYILFGLYSLHEWITGSPLVFFK